MQSRAREILDGKQFGPICSDGETFFSKGRQSKTKNYPKKLTPFDKNSEYRTGTLVQQYQLIAASMEWNEDYITRERESLHEWVAIKWQKMEPTGDSELSTLKLGYHGPDHTPSDIQHNARTSYNSSFLTGSNYFDPVVKRQMGCIPGVLSMRERHGFVAWQGIARRSFSRLRGPIGRLLWSQVASALIVGNHWSLAGKSCGREPTLWKYIESSIWKFKKPQN